MTAKRLLFYFLSFFGFKRRPAVIYLTAIERYWVHNMSENLLPLQYFGLAASVLDAEGNSLSPVLTWEVSDATVVSLTPSADTQSVEIVSLGKAGTVSVTAATGTLTSDPFVVVVMPGVPVKLTLSVSSPPQSPVVKVA